MPTLTIVNNEAIDVKINKTEEWGHECWDCGGVFQTKKKVYWKLPYFLLKRFYDVSH